MAVIEAIATHYLEADANSVEFTSIPQTYEHLEVRCSLRSTNATAEGVNNWMIVGSDSASNYHMHVAYASGTAEGGWPAGPDTKMTLGQTTGGGNPTANYTTLVVYIYDYTVNNSGKTVQFLAGQGCQNSANLTFGGNYQDNYTTISGLTFYFTSDKVARGSVFSLYGMNSS